ncbi:MAG: hypothetical protein MRY21_05565 [Simkaniaceae bacterium]|nr:hypothetical protein [Simkaniaceae bacterium]
MRWLIFFLPFFLYCSKEQAVFHSLDPHSIGEHFAFYKLYPQSEYGRKSLERAWELMHRHREKHLELDASLELPELNIGALIAFVNRQPYEISSELNETQLSAIEKITDHLPHKELKGHGAWSIDELYSLEPNEVDLSRALLIYEFGSDRRRIREYEANLDLMALQILARLPVEASGSQKVEAINHFIFHEKGFRFPPHSLYAKDIDVYTFLPSVLDSRLGVCLGVSILYISLAQRIDLDVGIVTPPGHIYVKHGDINIETTARGIHIPTREYLGLGNRKLPERNIKEVIALSFINGASVAWGRQEYHEAIDLYEKALPYLPDDPLLLSLLGFNFLFIGEEERGKTLIKRAKELPESAVSYPEEICSDYLEGRMPAKAIQAVFAQVDERRESILKKQDELASVVKKYPKFRDGIFHLAITWLQLSRHREALEVLERYHKIDPNNPTVEYYLTLLCSERLNMRKAWEHFDALTELIGQSNSQIISQLKKQLKSIYPKGESS